MKPAVQTPAGKEATQQTNASGIQHSISDDIFRALNTLKSLKVNTVRSALHDMFLEFNRSTPDDEIRSEVSIIYVTLLQLCDGLQEGAITENAKANHATVGSEKRILKAVYELFEWSDAKCYVEGLNLADHIMRETSGKEGGAFPKTAESTSFDINKIKEFIYQLEVLKLEHTIDKLAPYEKVVAVEDEILGTAA